MSDLLQYIINLECDEGGYNNDCNLLLLENTPVLELSVYLKNTYKYINLISYSKYEILFKIEDPHDQNNLIEIFNPIIENNSSKYTGIEISDLHYLDESTKRIKFIDNFGNNI